MKRLLLMAGTVICLLTLSCARNHHVGGNTENQPNDVVLAWNEVAYQAFGGTAYQHSLMASRINAMVHVAIHDAVNAVYPQYDYYAFNERDPGANAIAAAASAAHEVLLHEIPEKRNFLDSALEQTLSRIRDDEGKARGIALGKASAKAIIAARSDDGSAGNPVVPVTPSDVAGVYQPVPPFDFYFAPYWENVRLFSLESKDQFRCVPPPALNSDEYTAAFNEVKLMGRLNSNVRTTDQTGYAKFWYEFSEAGWNRVARTVAINKKLNLHETARLFALVDMAMADAYIAGWDSKLHYNFWRPYTAIRMANADNNSKTTADNTWEPAEPTPPIQDYPSTHSALGSAAAKVMARVLGDNTPFTMSSPTSLPPGGTRSFTSFSQAAKENADSRVRAGIHFRFACDAGLKLGDDIGNWMVDNFLSPIKK